MKKVLVVLFVLLALGTFAFAKQGFTLRGSIVYDFVNLRSAESEAPSHTATNWKANAFGTEFGVTYNFSDKFQLYADSSVGFYNKFTIGDMEITNNYKDKVSFLANAEHAGFAINIALDSKMDLQVGGGIAFENAHVTASETTDDKTATIEFGIFSFGLGLYANFDYKFSDRMALAVTVHPDVMFLSGDHVETSTSKVDDKTVTSESVTVTTFGTGASFKFNAAVGVKFSY